LNNLQALLELSVTGSSPVFPRSKKFFNTLLVHFG